MIDGLQGPHLRELRRSIRRAKEEGRHEDADKLVDQGHLFQMARLWNLSSPKVRKEWKAMMDDLDAE